MMVGPKRVRALSFVVIAGLAVAACSPGTPTQGPGATAQPGTSTTPGTTTAPSLAGGTAYVLLTTATSNGDRFTDMDPQRIYIGEDLAFFGATIMQSLTGYKYSPDPVVGTELVADAATDTGTPSADAKSWTFTIRDGMKWQDGSPVKCEDYAYGASRAFAIDVITNGPTYVRDYLDIGKNAEGNSLYPGPYKATPDEQALFDAAVSCAGNVITYKLAKPVADFNYTVTLGMSAVPNPVDHPGVDTAADYSLKPWSNGPYQIDAYTPGAGGNLTLVRNPNWSSTQDDGYRKAYPDSWVVLFGLDPQVNDQRLLAPTGDDEFALGYGNVQTQNFTSFFIDAKTPKPEFEGRALTGLSPYSGYWWINITKVPNVKIRQAMAVAIDRDAIRAASGGEFYGDFADGLVNPTIGADFAKTGWETDLFGQAIPPTGNIELAKQLIADSGEAAPTLTFDYGKSDAGDLRASSIKASLEAAGFTINLNPIASGYYATIGDPALQHDFGTSGWGPDWPNASTVIGPLLTGATEFNNQSDYSNVTLANSPEWYAAVADALSDTDRASQAKKWQDLNKQAAQLAYYIPNVFLLDQRVAGTKVTTADGLYRWPAYGSWPYAQIYLEK